MYYGTQLSTLIRNGVGYKHSLTFIYDDNGQALGFYYDTNLNDSNPGTKYYYVCNAQGDVLQLRDHTNAPVANYYYDAWGKLLGITDANGNAITAFNSVAVLNPIRYRGYFYDTETGFYYLNSRYYDPQIGRFINADDVNILDVDQGSFLQYNLYAYCLNNPVNMVDTEGYAAANIVGGILGGVTGATLGYLLADFFGLKGWKKWALISAATVGGAALGAFLGPYFREYIAKLGGKVVAKLGIKSIPKLGSQIGRLGKLVKNTKPAIEGFTRHGLQRMAQRGITQSLARNIVRSGHAIAQSGGKTLFFTKAGVVVLNRAGEVVTAYSSKFFDDAMKEIIRQFYG